MEQTARTRKVDIVVLGSGVLAATVATLLAERGKRVALLVEPPDNPEALRDAELDSLYTGLAAFAESYCITGTRVRGISVIEGLILGVVAEDARYDSRIVVNLAEDQRHDAYRRMMRQPPAANSATADIVPAHVTGGWELRGRAHPADVATLAERAVERIVGA